MQEFVSTPSQETNKDEEDFTNEKKLSIFKPAVWVFLFVVTIANVLWAYSNSKTITNVSIPTSIDSTISTVPTSVPLKTIDSTPTLQKACELDLRLPKGFTIASKDVATNNSPNTCMVINGPEINPENLIGNPQYPKEIVLNVYLTSWKSIDDFLIEESVFKSISSKYQAPMFREENNSRVVLFQRDNNIIKYLRNDYGGEKYVLLVDKGSFIYMITYVVEHQDTDIGEVAESIAKQLSEL